MSRSEFPGAWPVAPLPAAVKAPRGVRVDVCNPFLGLPSVKRSGALLAQARRAEKGWRQHEAPWLSIGAAFRCMRNTQLGSRDDHARG